MEETENIEFLNPNRAWVVAELEMLYTEWLSWKEAVESIVDQPFDSNTQADVYADGKDMMQKHEILQAKTLTFLNNNIGGHNFIRGFDGQHIDRKDLRLRIRVEHRLNELEILRACVDYARVPDSYWRKKGKVLVDKLVDKSGDAAIDIAESYLKNPMSGDS